MSTLPPPPKSPDVGHARVVIVGASGMVGGYALRYAIDHPAVGSVAAIGRKKLGMKHAKLEEILDADFADCSTLLDVLTGQDAAVFCLGANTGKVSDSEFRTITVDYPIEFARVLRAGSPCLAFTFLSGNGRIDSTQRCFATSSATAGRHRVHHRCNAATHLSWSGPRFPHRLFPGITGPHPHRDVYACSWSHVIGMVSLWAFGLRSKTRWVAVAISFSIWLAES